MISADPKPSTTSTDPQALVPSQDAIGGGGTRRRHTMLRAALLFPSLSSLLFLSPRTLSAQSITRQAAKRGTGTPQTAHRGRSCVDAPTLPSCGLFEMGDHPQKKKKSGKTDSPPPVPEMSIEATASCHACASNQIKQKPTKRQTPQPLLDLTTSLGLAAPAALLAFERGGCRCSAALENG